MMFAGQVHTVYLMWLAFGTALAPPNGLRQPPPGENANVEQEGGRHTLAWKNAPTGRSAERFVGRRVVEVGHSG
jgi:hypothetical protein